MGRVHARLYRISGGRFLPQWFAGAPVMVLVVLAANAGADRTPAWWLNLQDAGSGAVVIGRRRVRVRPRVLAGAERDGLWRAFVDMYPQAEHYTRFTARALPLIALEPERT
jgi:deazaflavin-dependent oxidoreductase (nitroreductase family)